MSEGIEKFRPEIIETVKKYNLIDDVMFEQAAKNKEFCQEVLRTICEDPELVVVENTTQCRVNNLVGHSVVLDAICELKDGTLINIEVQKSNVDDYKRRARYHEAVLSANFTPKNNKYKDIVPNIIIIFIMNFDFFKNGCALYHIDKIVRETGEVFDNGFSEIYVNAKAKDDSDVSELMRIFVDSKAYNEEMFPAVSGVKRHYKENKEGVQSMCELTEKLVKKVRAEGFLESIKNLIENLDVTVDKAMDILKIPSVERSFYLEKLKK